MSQLKIKDGNNWVNIPASGIGIPSGGSSGDVLTKSSSTDYATEWKTPQNMVLLWTNPNPSADFDAQTVSLDLSSYSAVLIEAGSNSANLYVNDYIFTMPTTGTKQGQILTIINMATAQAYDIIYREIILSATGIEFKGGLQKASNSTQAATTNNARQKPLRIWGIKY